MTRSVWTKSGPSRSSGSPPSPPNIAFSWGSWSACAGAGGGRGLAAWPGCEAWLAAGRRGTAPVAVVGGGRRVEAEVEVGGGCSVAAASPWPRLPESARTGGGLISEFLPLLVFELEFECVFDLEFKFKFEFKFWLKFVVLFFVLLFFLLVFWGLEVEGREEGSTLSPSWLGTDSSCSWGWASPGARLPLAGSSPLLPPTPLA